METNQTKPPPRTKRFMRVQVRAYVPLRNGEVMFVIGMMPMQCWGEYVLKGVLHGTC